MKKEKGKYDIIAFLHFSSESYYSKVEEIKSVYSYIPHNQTVFQQELSIYITVWKRWVLLL